MIKSALFLALVQLCTIWFGPRGPVLHKRIRQLGGEVYLHRVEENIVATEELTGVSRFLIAKLAHGESSLDRRRVNAETGASGLMQLKPNTPHWREWRRVCRLSPEDCTAANLLIGARYLRESWQICGAGWAEAVARYRGAGCLARDIDTEVVEQAEELRLTSIQRMLALQHRGGA